jgi:hypothetical protein
MAERRFPRPVVPGTLTASVPGKALRSGKRESGSSEGSWEPAAGTESRLPGCRCSCSKGYEQRERLAGMIRDRFRLAPDRIADSCPQAIGMVLDAAS